MFGEPTQRQRELGRSNRSPSRRLRGRPAWCALLSYRRGRPRGHRKGRLRPRLSLPGLPHRTGHGIGLDIHEAPYMDKGNDQPLEPGMCGSIEPMLSIPGEVGIRLEDHFYMTDDGAKWFTEPSASIEAAFWVATEHTEFTEKF